MNNKKTAVPAIIAVAIVGMLLTMVTTAALSDSQILPFSGTISTVNVEAYTDSACTIPATTLNVGSVSPGSTVTQTVYIKNTGTIPMTLTMTTSSWSPTNAGSYLTLSWNRQNYLLNAGQSVQATITLNVAANTGTLATFSCSVTITGTQ